MNLYKAASERLYGAWLKVCQAAAKYSSANAYDQYETECIIKMQRLFRGKMERHRFLVHKGGLARKKWRTAGRRAQRGGLKGLVPQASADASEREGASCNGAGGGVALTAQQIADAGWA
jgi:hypothetical protein